MEDKAKRKHKIFGRPPIVEEEKRALKVSVFLSRSEAAQLREKSETAAITLPELLRRAALGKKIDAPKSFFDSEAVAELRAIGQNINQTARELSRARLESKNVDYRQLEIILQKKLAVLNEIKDEIFRNK